MLLVTTGCSNATDSENESSTSTTSETASTTSGTSEQQTSPQQPQTASKESTQKSAPKLDEFWPKPLAEPRKSMKGNWVVNVFLDGKEYPACLLKVDAEEENSLTAKVLDVPDQIDKANLASSEITQTSANVVLEMEPPLIQFSRIDFQGTLKEGVVIGNVLLDGIFCVPARLIATDDDSIPPALQPQTGPFYEEFQQAIESYQSSGSFELLRKFGNDHPKSPSAIDALRVIFSQVEDEQLKVEDVEKLAEKYLATAGRWGPRMVTFAYLQIGGTLADERYLPELALKYLDETEKRLSDDSSEQWKLILESTKKEAEVTYAISRLPHENEDIRKKAAEVLRQHQTQQPFDHRILSALADYYEKQNQPDQAINWYAQFTVALPLIHPRLRDEWLTENIDHPLPGEDLA
ncbi:MAG: hypothetical protein IH899_11870, partial [Planctomycetes bacterium]|nr:hypothetical protein [Planctomycetota bacterium]